LVQGGAGTGGVIADRALTTLLFLFEALCG